MMMMLIVIARLRRRMCAQRCTHLGVQVGRRTDRSRRKTRCNFSAWEYFLEHKDPCPANRNALGFEWCSGGMKWKTSPPHFFPALPLFTRQPGQVHTFREIRIRKTYSVASDGRTEYVRRAFGGANSFWDRTTTTLQDVNPLPGDGFNIAHSFLRLVHPFIPPVQKKC